MSRIVQTGAAARIVALASVLAATAGACVSGGAVGPTAVGSVAGAPPGVPATLPAVPGRAAEGPAATAPIRSVSPSGEGAPTLQATLVSRSLWPGRATILLALQDAANAPAGGLEVPVRVAVEGSTGGAAPRWVDARYAKLAVDGRGLYAAEVTLPPPGDVTISVEATAFGVAHRTSVTTRVRDPGATPALGSPAPRTDTPTFASAAGDLGRVTTDPVPDRRLYWLSVRQAIDMHRPFVIVLDSFAFRPSPACGGALGIVHHLADEYPSVSFIHAEAYATRVIDGLLAADPPGGPLRPATWTAAWGAESAPWVFVVDASGLVRAKFSGIVGTDEIRAAIRSVAGWVPTY